MERIGRLSLCLVLVLPGNVGAAGDAGALIDRALKAMGGEANLTRLQAATWKGRGTYFGLGQSISYAGDWAVQPPERARIAIQGEFRGQPFSRVLVINGNKGWIKLNDQVEEMNKETLAEEKQRLYANWVASLAPLKDPAFELSLVDDKRIGEQACDGVKVKREGQREVILYFDKKTSFLVQSETRVKDVLSGMEYQQEVRYSNYRLVEGIRRAMKIEVRWDGKKFAEGELSDFKPSEKLEAKLFAEP